MESSQIWPQCLGFISQRVTERSFQTWFKPTKCLSFGAEGITIGVPSHFFAEWLEQHYLPLIQESIAAVTKMKVPVSFSVSSVGSNLVQGSKKRRIIFHPPQRGELELNPRYTFDTFVVGESNQFAHAASLAVAEAPGKTKFNPLFIYGGVGLGKTHLIQAIGHFIGRNRSQAKVEYVTSEKFTMDFISSIANKTTSQFSQKYRSLDVLLVDDIQFFSGKERTQSEFFHTFNALRDNGRQIVLTSDRVPKAMVTLEERLRSRFEWGLIVDIQPPDYETRMAILQSKAERMSVEVSNDILSYIATNIESNIRELEGALNRVLAMSKLTGLPLDRTVVEKALGDLLPNRPEVTAEDIIKAVSSFYGVSPEELKGSRRTRTIAQPRQIAMYLMREETDASLPQIGAELGGRDHTTILYGYERVRARLEQDDQFKRELMLLKSQLYGDT